MDRSPYTLSAYYTYEERKVYYCVSTKDLPKLRETMDPLTQIQRSEIVSTMIQSKSFVYRASEYGSLQIIQYLVVDCGADVNFGYMTPMGNYVPLFAAINRLDLNTVRTLVKLGVDINWTDMTGVNSVVYACMCGSLSIAKYLKLNGADINCDSNVKLCSESLDYCKLSAEVGADLDFQDSEGRTVLIHAAGTGRHNIVNFLLRHKVDRHKRDTSGLNALCNSILNDQCLMIKQLLMFAYSIDDYISALELCGANLLLFNRYVTVGLDYWKTTVSYRKQSANGFGDKIQPITLDAPFRRGEFRSENTVVNLASNKTQRILQALLVYLRVLTAENPTTHDAFSYVSVATEIKNDLTLALSLNEHLYEMYTGGSTPFLSAAEKAITNIVAIFKTNINELDFSDASVIIPHFDKAFDFLKTHVWPELKEKEFSAFNREQYGIFLSTILDFVGVIIDFTLGSDVEQKFKGQIKTIGKTFIDRYPTSLLHVAVQTEIPDWVLSYVLKCGVELNFQDEFKSAPIHCALENPFNVSRSRIMLLIKAGCRLDISNDFNLVPLPKLLSMGVLIGPLSLADMQRITARSIQRKLLQTSRQNKSNTPKDSESDH